MTVLDLISSQRTMLKLASGLVWASSTTDLVLNFRLCSQMMAQAMELINTNIFSTDISPSGSWLNTLSREVP